MQPSLDIRRHGDGSIDYDFYRRRAKRERRIARRRILVHCLVEGGRLAGAGAVAIASLVTDASRQRLLARAGAALLIAVAGHSSLGSGKPMIPRRSAGGGPITSY
jgi:hypothetical protein